MVGKGSCCLVLAEHNVGKFPPVLWPKTRKTVAWLLESQRGQLIARWRRKHHFLLRDFLILESRDRFPTVYENNSELPALHFLQQNLSGFLNDFQVDAWVDGAEAGQNP